MKEKVFNNCKKVNKKEILITSEKIGLKDWNIELTKTVLFEILVVNNIKFWNINVLFLPVVNPDVVLYPTEIFVGVIVGSSVEFLRPLNKNLFMGETLVSI